MSELQIIGLPQSNFVWATRIAIAEKGVPHTLLPAPPHSPEVTAIHPLGKIPVMRHGDLTLAESRAICTYVDESFDGPPLRPRDPKRAAKAEEWTSIVVATMEPVLIRQYLFAYMFPTTADKEPDRARIGGLVPQLERYLGILDRAAASGDIGGQSFTLTDAYLVPILFYLRTVPESAEILTRSGALTDYLGTRLERPSVRETMPPGMN